MTRSFGVLLAMMALVSCRRYDLHSRLANQKGLIPADQFARYGREQAQEMAIAREYGAGIDGSSPEAVATQAEAATELRAVASRCRGRPSRPSGLPAYPAVQERVANDGDSDRRRQARGRNPRTGGHRGRETGALTVSPI